MDMVDLFGFLAAAAVSFSLVHIKFFRHGSVYTACQILFFVIVAAVFADSFNKIDGYPENEFKGLLATILSICLQGALLVMLVRYKRLFFAAFIVGLIAIHTPLVTAPVSIARQYRASRVVVRHPALQCEELYFTKIEDERAFALGRNRLGYVTVVYRRDRSTLRGVRYLYENTFWLPSKLGSAFRQQPNASETMIGISTFALRQLRDDNGF